MLNRLLLALSLAGIAAGGAGWLAGNTELADLAWRATTILVAIAAAVWVVQGLRERGFGTDLIALLALLGTLAVEEYLAGAIIAVMLTGGQWLEKSAQGRARRDLAELVSRAPRYAHRVESGDTTSLHTIDVGEVSPGDLLLVRSGETVPVDGQVAEASAPAEGGAAARLDESAVTGEPLPAARAPGDPLASGTINIGDPFQMRATTDAAHSTYAGIMRLTREAHAHGAPFVRMADRYAGIFLPVTLLLAGGAWLLSGDPVRAVAVLVVATPCPLILAAPVAITSGLSRAARIGVVVKNGGALERLARARTLMFDKTGTVTQGRPFLRTVAGGPAPFPPEEVLRFAASVDQVSPHPLAAAIVRAARDEGLHLDMPADVTEVSGQGVRGTVAGHEVAVGKAMWAAPWAAPSDLDAARRQAAASGALTVFVGVDGALAGTLLLEDALRDDAARTFDLLREAGIGRTVMVTGDRAPVAAAIAGLVGADAVYAEQSPADKAATVRTESASAPTVMVGDGVNDAPALASAGVGVALGARGTTVASEAADVVITVDRLDRLAETMAIARRSRAIARQSVLVGMGLSLAAMGVAAFGFLPPVAGAVVQEGIDVAVILNALRALGPGRASAGSAPPGGGTSAHPPGAGLPARPE